MMIRRAVVPQIFFFNFIRAMRALESSGPASSPGIMHKGDMSQHLAEISWSACYPSGARSDATAARTGCRALRRGIARQDLLSEWGRYTNTVFLHQLTNIRLLSNPGYAFLSLVAMFPTVFASTREVRIVQRRCCPWSERPSKTPVREKITPALLRRGIAVENS